MLCCYSRRQVCKAALTKPCVRTDEISWRLPYSFRREAGNRVLLPKEERRRQDFNYAAADNRLHTPLYTPLHTTAHQTATDYSQQG